jgi:hypothetical protein
MIPNFFTVNPEAHFMTPGSVGFIPPWVFLFITVLAFVLLFPKFFSYPKVKVMSPLLLAFLVGTLMPVFDDLAAFVFGPPLAHHSLFHSLLGLLVTYLLFRLIATTPIAKYAFWGNLAHILFNFYFDYLTLFFPFTYQEFGLTDILKVDTYWIKAIHYPLILLLFAYSVIRFFFKQKKRP